MTVPSLEPVKFARKWTRIVVAIPVTVTSVLESGEGIIVDLSEHGLQIHGFSLPKGKKFEIDYEGQTIYGVVAWSEFDRMGCRLPFGLHDGPLYEQLMQARVTQDVGRPDILPESQMSYQPRPSIGALSNSGFGRRRS